ncbi:MAG TPA: hypothetical protein K8U95_04660 [Pseudomonas nitrititolerans]|uniref:hypothetical protein n=1 Tax=Stutzerimonas nitrititolerans TaxID=2482751 RepID=UPI001DB1E212|nr:hypothetical protein [Stutzerimonas nitrititolerans]HJE28464.1 hypothetical protein [Stutzerimonas nitrititolerans]
MYELFNHGHQGLAMLSLLLTLGWAAVVLFAPRPSAGLGGMQRLFYIGAMAVTGLAGVSGLVLVALAMGAWLALLFPWLGLVAVAGHGFAGVRSRKALVAGNKATAVVAVVVQILLLVGAYGLMTVKPF